MKKTSRIIIVLLLIAAMLIGTVSVYAASVAGYEKISDLNGKKIGVQSACLYEEHIRDRCPDTFANDQIYYYTMPQDMILALNANKIDSYIIEEVGYYATAVNHPELEVLDESVGLCEAAVIVGNNDKQTRLLGELNRFISDHKEDGVLDEMYDYWVRNFDAETSKKKDCTFTGENGELVIAVEGGYEPFSYVSNGEDNGFDIDFIYRFCEEYGYTPNLQRVAFESIAPGAETGKFDLGMNIILSDEREENTVLSDVYYTCDIFMVVLGEGEEKAGLIDTIKDNFNNTFVKESRWKMFASGAWTTFYITICSIAFGTLLGFALYLANRHKTSTLNKIVNKVTDGFLWLIHGMPTVVLLMILYYIIFGSTRLSGEIVAIVGFTLIFCASMYDMLSVGFQAIGRGQFEAATALGYSENESFFKILLPQAARHFLPIYKSEVVTLIKETSVAGYIAIQDLTKVSDLVRARTYQAFFALILTAVMYFILSGILTTAVDMVEKKIDPKRRLKNKILEGIVEEPDQY